MASKIDADKAVLTVNGIKVADVVNVSITPTKREEPEWDALQTKQCFVCGESNWFPVGWQMDYGPIHVRVKLDFSCLNCGTEYHVRCERGSAYWGMK